MNKKQVRKIFRTSVFNRDKHKCRVCGEKGKLDAHHITNRKKMDYGGYVIENGISLCPDCHIKAENILNYYQDGTDEDFLKYSPDNLYKLINSSYELAVEKSKIKWF